MINLKDILYDSGVTNVYGVIDVDVENIVFDSREVSQNSVFVAIKGSAVDGHEFIDTAIQKGVLAIVCEVVPETLKEGVIYVVVKSATYALAIMSSNFYNNPSREIKLIGITGTNGKTTSVTLMHTLVVNLGFNAGLLSTVVNKIGSVEIPSTHTTPNPMALNQLLREMVVAGCDYCFMEVSSHAIHRNRIAGLEFDVAGFTNISHDHLDYHKTF